MSVGSSPQQGKDTFINRTKGLTNDEWRELPVTFGITEMARLVRCNWRYMSDHAAEFGGRKVAGRWLFSKSEAAKLLGLEV